MNIIQVRLSSDVIDPIMSSSPTSRPLVAVADYRTIESGRIEDNENVENQPPKQTGLLNAKLEVRIEMLVAMACNIFEITF